MSDRREPFDLHLFCCCFDARGSGSGSATFNDLNLLSVQTKGKEDEDRTLGGIDVKGAVGKERLAIHRFWVVLLDPAKERSP